PDGNIEFLGREDFQVKVHGHRIELGEIEAALTQHPLVRTALVTAQGKSRTNKRLVAYVVPAEPETINGHSSSSPLTDAFHHEGESDYGNAVITDPIKRLEFKAKQPGLRQDNFDAYIQLLRPAPDDPLKKMYAGRSSKRSFLHEPIAFEKFSNFLNCVGELRLDSVPKYRYGSAGGLYPVQLYLYVKSNRVQGMEEGTYYYHPQQHRLFVISRKATIDQHLQFPVNRELFGESAFSLFLVVQFDAIKPLYGTSSRDFCLLEAGLMTQLLESSAADNQLGLCQIGKLKDHGTVKSLFKLNETQAVLHSMVGGAPSDLSMSQMVKTDAEAGRSKGSLISELRQFVQKKLPNYMVPANFVVLEKLPLSANGKLDRNALPEIGDQVLGQGDAPRTETEKAIAQVFQEVLQISQIGTDLNFFDLGSDSVEVVIIHRKLNQVLGDFPLLAMFEHPTVSRLARSIKTESNGKHSFAETEDRARKQKEALTRQNKSRARA
ncbi:MAG TPA: SagB family peptide dehydrogenase, partial [Candidatus Angelobacter sp.]